MVAIMLRPWPLITPVQGAVDNAVAAGGANWLSLPAFRKRQLRYRRYQDQDYKLLCCTIYVRGKVYSKPSLLYVCMFVHHVLKF